MVTDNDYMDQLVKEGPPPAPKRQTTFSKLSTISAVELQSKNIPPLQFVVENFLPTGLTIICSPPKYYKSWMMLDLGLCISAGKPFLGHPTNQCGCLYLALEDGERRLKDRMSKLLDGERAPVGFYFATVASTIKNGLCEMLDDFLKVHSGVRLVIIDTFQFVRDGARANEAPYAADYREVSTLKRFADSHNITLLLVHHLSKRVDDGDPYNMISGTTGITGAADTIMVLTRTKRSDTNTTLSYISRDVEDRETILTFDRSNCRWSIVGDAKAIEQQRDSRRYESNLVVKTVKALLSQNPDGWTGTASQLMDAGLQITHQAIAASPRALTAELTKLDDQLYDDCIVHERIPHGTGGGKHQFRRIPIDEDILTTPLPDIQF